MDTKLVAVLLCIVATVFAGVPPPVGCPREYMGPACNDYTPCKPGYTCLAGFCCRDQVACPREYMGPACNDYTPCKSGYTCTAGFCCRDQNCPRGMLEGGPCNTYGGMQSCTKPGYECINNFCCKRRRHN